MSLDIHCKQRSGVPVYRVFSNTSDSYVTEEVTEAEVRAYTLKQRLLNVIDAHACDIEIGLELARTRGTSSQFEDQSLMGDWAGEG